MKLKITTLLTILCCIAIAPSHAEKSISILGDSYSTFEGHVTPSTNRIWYFKERNLTRTDVREHTETWWWRLVSENGYRLERNNSSSGTTICNTGYKGSDATKTSFLARANDLGNPDIILIFGATNDDWANVAIGDYVYRDWSKEELYTFRPAMAKLLHDLKANYPDAELYFILNDKLDSEIDDSALQICKRYKVKCIELKEIDKLSNHPSRKGMEQISKQVAAQIK